MAWNKPLKGIVTPLATPLLGQDTIDEIGTRKLIEHVIQGGVSGIFLLGSTGEGPSLSYKAKRDFVSQACQIVADYRDNNNDDDDDDDDGVPVLVSVSDTSLAETIAFAKYAHLAGASAVVLTQPYYFTIGPTQETITYVEKVLEGIPKDLPVMLYNMPLLTKSSWNVDAVRTLAQRHKQIVGIKDSSGDLAYFERLCTLKKDLQHRPDFTVMIGPEHLLAEAMSVGGDGGVCGGSNVLPELFSSLYQAILKGTRSSNEDNKKIQKLIAGVDELQAVYTLVGSSAIEDHPFSRFIAGTKCALAAKGICEMHVNQPFSGYGDEELLKTKKILLELEEKLKDL